MPFPACLALLGFCLYDSQFVFRDALDTRWFSFQVKPKCHSIYLDGNLVKHHSSEQKHDKAGWGEKIIQSRSIAGFLHLTSRNSVQLRTEDGATAKPRVAIFFGGGGGGVTFHEVGQMINDVSCSVWGSVAHVITFGAAPRLLTKLAREKLQS